MLTYHDKEVFDMTTQELLQKAKASKAAMALADTDRKNRALLAMADALIARADPILRRTPWIWRRPEGPSLR